MSTASKKSGQGALRGAQTPHGHAGAQVANAALASSMMSAAQVAAIGYRKAGYPATVEGVRGYADSLVADVAALVAQDGRWRALAGDLLTFAQKYAQHAPSWCQAGDWRGDHPCTCGLAASESVLARAEAALDGEE